MSMLTANDNETGSYLDIKAGVYHPPMISTLFHWTSSRVFYQRILTYTMALAPLSIP